jgi:hypothetical protein
MNLAEQSLSFDDLLNAVQESSRGRWFLGKYEERIRSTGTENILSSIAKLENAIAGMSNIGGDNALLARAKAAIAAARSDIAKLDQSEGQPNLSNEARLFAKLADMARASFNADGKTNDNSVVNTGVVRALRLVDELDQAMAAPHAVTANYFAPHAEVFEAPAPVAIAAPTTIAAEIKSTPKAVEKIEPERGAKLTIKRSSDVPAAVAPVPEPQAPIQILETVITEPVSITTPPTDIPFVDAPVPQPSEPEAAAKPRVVIIRRKPEDVMEVPMVEEATTPQSESSAA